MKNFLSTIAIMLALPCIKINAQNTFPASGSAGIGTSAPNASALLEVKSTSKGILTPRMTKAQRDAITSPATGLLIFQTNNTPGFYFFDGNVWKTVSSTNFANKTLSNLSSTTKINSELLPDTTNTIDLGSISLAWKDLHLNGSVFNGGLRSVSFEGSNNTFIGENAGISNTTANNNSFFGRSAGASNTTGITNSFFGSFAGDNNTSGTQNCFFGANSGTASINGNGNAFFGFNSGLGNLSSNNSFFGSQAGDANILGSNNAFFGRNAGGNNSFADDNSFFGTSSGLNTINGNENCFFGKEAGAANTNGTGVAAFGFRAGFTHDPNSFCTFIGYQSDNVTANNLSNANAFGFQSRVTAANQVRIGNSSIGSIGGFVGFSNISDVRFKKNIKQNVPGLEFINKLNPVTYTLDVKGLQNFLHENDHSNERANELNARTAAEKEKVVYTGFIAQEVETAAKELNYDFSGVDKPNNEESLYGLRYAEFTVPLVKAVQELSKENKELKAEIEMLKSEVRGQKSEVRRQRTEVRSSSSDILLQNSPNPFSEKTTIRCEINSEFSSAKIVIRNLDGAVMIEQIISSNGKNEIEVNARTLSAGTYTYTLEINNVSVDTKLMVITK